MQQDDVIWQVVRNSFCSFKIKTDTQQFCRNEYNVTGLCNRSSCPLANSRYATVREHGGRAYLYMKTIERAHTPARMWERVMLPKSYVEALEAIDRELEHYPSALTERCKQRLTRIAEYLTRMRKMQLKGGPRSELVPVKKAVDRRERKREARAEAVARLDKVIAAELVERLKAGSYDDVILNAREGVWGRVLRSRAINAKTDQDADNLSENEDVVDEFVEDVSDLEDEDGTKDDDEDRVALTRDLVESDSDTSDLEDIVPAKVAPSERSQPKNSLGTSRGRGRGRGQSSPRGRDGKRVEVEYEHEMQSQLFQRQRRQ